LLPKTPKPRTLIVKLIVKNQMTDLFPNLTIF